MALRGYTSVKVFSATRAKDRDGLGEHITLWLRSKPDMTVVDAVVRLTSDAKFHCLSITLFLVDE